MIKIIEITDDLRDKYNDYLIVFTKNFVYPFGFDSFTIDHGKNYFTFFDRLGKPLSFIAMTGGRIVATVTGVIRSIDIYGQGHTIEVLYICDLKVDKQFRDQFIVQKFLKFALEKYQSKFTHAYGISMNNRILGENKVTKFAQAIPNLNFRKQDTLASYLLNSSQLNRLEPILRKYFKSYNFVSLLGIKDLILSSTQLALPFMHFSSQYQERLNSKLNANQYMLCFPLSHEITSKMSLAGLNYFTTASVISNMDNVDWLFIETSDI